jgi:uncharacterized membrane protein
MANQKARTSVYYQDHMGTGGWMFMALAGVVLLGLVLAFVVWLVRDQRRPHREHYVTGGSAAEILDRRLATGAINIQEYERVKTSLATPPSRPPAATEQPPAPET